MLVLSFDQDRRRFDCVHLESRSALPFIKEMYIMARRDCVCAIWGKSNSIAQKTHNICAARRELMQLVQQCIRERVSDSVCAYCISIYTHLPSNKRATRYAEATKYIQNVCVGVGVFWVGAALFVQTHHICLGRQRYKI